MYSPNDSTIPVCGPMQEALLAQACNERRRAASEGPSWVPPQPPRCSYNNEGEPCPAPVLPLSPYCQKRILFTS